MVPFGPQPKISLSKGFFDVAAAQEPKPQTVAVVSADAEFAQGAAVGARENLKAHGFKIVYDRTYPATLLDFSSVIRAVQAANPDIVYVASFPVDGVGVVRAANEVRLKTKLFGGSMVGMQSTPLRMQLGPLLNGLVYHDFWVPDPKLMFPGIEAFLATYQARAVASGVDPLGYYAPPYAYARMQVIGQAIAATGTLDADKLAAYLRANVLHTIVGDIRFNQDGEWSGDVYDNEAPNTITLRAPIERMKPFSDIQWHLLPGNHDPHRPEGVWDRVAQLGLPAHIHVHLTPTPVPLTDGAFLLPAPLLRKTEFDDLTAWMDNAPTPPGALRIGLAHGAVTNFTSEGEASNPIDPARLAKAKLDYLALGDWHRTLQIGPAVWYAGTPEPDRAGRQERGTR
jgi:hypothetical protein